MQVSFPTLAAGRKEVDATTTSSKGGITAATGKDQFMKLLVNELRQQDPLDPVKDREFVSQLTELSTLESIENLNTTFTQMMQIQQLSQGANLIGKTVKFKAADTGDTLSGIVQGLETKDSKVQIVTADGTRVALDGILGVTGAA